MRSGATEENSKQEKDKLRECGVPKWQMKNVPL